MSSKVEVNGNSYTEFKQIDISDSLDDFARTARLIITEPANNSSIIKINDKVSIYLDDIKVITGYVEKISDSESDNSHDINIELRSLTADLIDSCCPDDLKFLEGVATYKDLVQKAIDALGLDITITDEVNISFSDEIKSAELGQTCFDFLNEYARKAQVFLNSDGDGNVLIRRPGGNLTTWLVEGNNILESRIELDYSQRFNSYTVYSNSNVTAEGNTDNLNVSGNAVDSIINSTRIFEKRAEKPMTADECANAAIEEANIRRIRGFKYSCKVSGFSGNDELWEIGKLVNIRDDKKGVNGAYVIKDINYTVTSGGDYTSMTMTLPDAYKLTAELPGSDAAAIDQATVYNEG